MKPTILLSFDVEEFDIPLEYNCTIDSAEQMQVGKQGLDVMLPIVDAFNIATTMFTTANFAIHFPEAVKHMAVNHEIASHTFYHTTFTNEDLFSSKLALEEICGKPVTGLRMPRMRFVEMDEVKKQVTHTIHLSILHGCLVDIIIYIFQEHGIKKMRYCVCLQVLHLIYVCLYFG